MNTAILITMLGIVGVIGTVPSGANEVSAQNHESASESFDLMAGKSLYRKSCKNCHGPTAKGMASFPKLAGNSAEYLIDRLTVYRSGEKVGPNTALMSPQAMNLSDADIANVAHYIATEFD